MKYETHCIRLNEMFLPGDILIYAKEYAAEALLDLAANRPCKFVRVQGAELNRAYSEYWVLRKETSNEFGVVSP